MTALSVISASALEELQLAQWLETLDATVDHCAPPLPCGLIVTPVGMPQRPQLAALLDEVGIRVLARRALTGWARLSTAIQVRRRHALALHRAVIFERLWEALHPGAVAEQWLLSAADHARLVELKRGLRARLHNLHVELATLPKAACLHAFHLADPEDVVPEARRLEAATHLLSRPVVITSR